MAIVRLFERDVRGNVLWFSAPPLPPGAIKIPEPPGHSLEYLTYLAKRKLGDMTKPDRPGKRLVAELPVTAKSNVVAVNGGDKDSEKGSEDSPMFLDVEGDLGGEWWARDMSSDEIFAGLKAIVDSA